MQYDAPSPPPPIGALSPDVDAIVAPLFGSAGWLKFLGVMSIIGGALTAMTCYGIVIAWLPIWLGILQWQAGDRLSVGYQARDAATLASAADKLRMSFKIQGITLLCVMAFYVVLFVLFIGVALLGGVAGAMQGAGAGAGGP